MTSPLRLPPLLLPLCLFISGIAAAGSFGILLPYYLFPLAIILPAPLLFLRSPIYFNASLCLTLFVTGNLLISPLLQKSQDDISLFEKTINKALILEGVIVQRPEIKDGGCKILLRVEHLEDADNRGKLLSMNGHLLLRIGSSDNNFATGDRIRFKGKLKPPRNFGTAGEFNAERFYALKGISATSFVKNDAAILLMRQGVESRFQRHFDTTAADIGRFIMQRIPGVEGGVMKALLIGDMSDIPQEIKDQYSITGVNHILSISGFHIGIIALVLFQIWFAISRLFPILLIHLNFRRFALAASIPFILYYMFLSGAAPATARSVIMLGLLIAGLIIERELDQINSLALAAFALLLIKPVNLYDISFQLSFLALWGLTVITPLLSKPFESKFSGWRYNLLLFTAASTAAVTVTLLPVAYYFQQSSITGIISNFFIVPLLGYGAVVTGFAALPFIWLYPVIAGYLLYVAGILTTTSNLIIALLAKLPTLPIFIPTETEIAILLIAMLFITVIKNSYTRSGILLILPIFLVLFHQIPADDNDYSLKIDFLSVGQGESTLFTFADGQRMLIDGGGALHEGGWDIGRQLLLPTLKKMGIKRIDYLVLTHPHPDHLQGVKAVAEALVVGEFWGSELNAGDDYEKLIRTLQFKKVPLKKLDNASAPVEISGIRINCLYPIHTELTASDMNESSLILRFDSGKFSALFTGDIGFETEFRLLGKTSLLKSTILKVPHHGSRYSTSPEFLDAVSPQIALISAGYNNSFGLPAAETIEQLAAKRIRTYRTDLDGTISVKFPKIGKNLVISAFKRQTH